MSRPQQPVPFNHISKRSKLMVLAFLTLVVCVEARVVYLVLSIHVGWPWTFVSCLGAVWMLAAGSRLRKQLLRSLRLPV